MTEKTTKRSSEEIQEWLVSFVAREIGSSPGNVPVDEQLVNLGLSSRNAILMIGKLGEFAGKPTDPGLVWDYPTIRQLAEYLAKEN